MTDKVKQSWCVNQSEAPALHLLLCKFHSQISLNIDFINLFRPDGTIAILYSSGAFVRYQEAGLLWCLPWTETKYLVSMQDFVYESPNNQVLTLDNSNVSISLSLLMKFTKEKDYIQQLATNVSEINELIDANI